MPYKNSESANSSAVKPSEIAAILARDPFDVDPPVDVQAELRAAAEALGDVVTGQTREEFLAWLEGQEGAAPAEDPEDLVAAEATRIIESLGPERGPRLTSLIHRLINEATQRRIDEARETLLTFSEDFVEVPLGVLVANSAYQLDDDVAIDNLRYTADRLSRGGDTDLVRALAMIVKEACA